MRSNYLIYIATIFNLTLQNCTSQSIINDDINANSRDAEDKAHVRRRKLRYSNVFDRDGGDNIFEREKRVADGGQNAVSNRFPYYAYLKGQKGISCGGTLIAPDIVLTAAHCVNIILVQVGRNDLWAWDDAYEEFSVEKEYTHPDYDETTKRFDQKVLKLSGISQAEPLTPKTDFSSISMELMDNLNIVGFGQPDSDGTYPSRLQYVQQRYVPFEECTKLSYNGTIYDDMICAAGNNQTTTGDCFGDSGEPLILQGSGPSEDVQIGWVSWGVEPCAGLPVVFQNVSAHFEWLSDTVCSISSDPPGAFRCPTPEPSTQPPSALPSSMPSTPLPSALPSSIPSDTPSLVPSLTPSQEPSVMPSDFPSLMPSQVPSTIPSDEPSLVPSVIPSDAPSLVPSVIPSDAPSLVPSGVPSLASSIAPSAAEVTSSEAKSADAVADEGVDPPILEPPPEEQTVAPDKPTFAPITNRDTSSAPPIFGQHYSPCWLFMFTIGVFFLALL